MKKISRKEFIANPGIAFELAEVDGSVQLVDDAGRARGVISIPREPDDENVKPPDLAIQVELGQAAVTRAAGIILTHECTISNLRSQLKKAEEDKAILLDSLKNTTSLFYYNEVCKERDQLRKLAEKAKRLMNHAPKCDVPNCACGVSDWYAEACK